MYGVCEEKFRENFEHVFVIFAATKNFAHAVIVISQPLDMKQTKEGLQHYFAVANDIDRTDKSAINR